MTDPRKLPTEKVAEVALEIYTAANADNNEQLDKACRHWLDIRGYEENSLVTFSFVSLKKRHDIEVGVTAGIRIGEVEDHVSRVSGNPPLPKDDSKEELVRVSVILLMGINAALESASRKVFESVVFPNASNELALKLHDAAAMLTTITV